MKLFKRTILSLATAVLTAVSAQAIVFDITSDHATGGLGTPPFGTVTLTQNGLNVDFNVSLTAGYSFVKTGTLELNYFVFNGVGVALSDIVNINQNDPGFTLSAQTTGGPYGGGGLGDFTFGITSTHGTGGSFPTYLGPLTFTVNNATIAELTVPSSGGNIFLVDLLAPNGNTGVADVTTPGTPVPDGGMTVALLGGAFAGIELLRRKMLKV